MRLLRLLRTEQDNTSLLFFFLKIFLRGEGVEGLDDFSVVNGGGGGPGGSSKFFP